MRKGIKKWHSKQADIVQLKKQESKIKMPKVEWSFLCSPKWYSDFSHILEEHFKESTNEFKDKMGKASGINFDSIDKRIGK